MTERSKDTLKVVLTTLAGFTIFIMGLLWNQNYDYIKRVDAKCIRLDETKADLEDMREVKSRLIRIEDKIDRIKR